MKHLRLAAVTAKHRMNTMMGKDVFVGFLRTKSPASMDIKSERSPLSACMIASPKQGDTGKIISVMNS